MSRLATNTSDPVINDSLIWYPRIGQLLGSLVHRPLTLQPFHYIYYNHKGQVRGNAVFWYQLSTCSALLRCAVFIARLLSDPHHSIN